jgi:aspartyl-tRNA(Asn)/glutamyl-tRNA(Gln) amidotransferase subunit A
MYVEPAWQTAERVRRKEMTAREATEAALRRIDELNPQLNAFTAVDADLALQQAAAVDARIARGEVPGPLAGVPIGVKDLEPAAGLPWTMGSRVFRDRVATVDSVQVSRLKEAGAVVVGKTNTPEFGYKGFTTNLVYGASRNPWNPERTPGGSSGGSAAAVTAGMVALCTGSDGGGSVRIPAAFSGCYGIKPTCGRIPRAGESASHWAFLSHLGPLSRTVRDAARYLDIAAGPHPNDLESLDLEATDYEATLDRLPKLRRIAYSVDLGYAPVDPAVRALTAEAAKALGAALGVEVVEAHPGFADPIHTWMVIATAGDAAMHAGWTEEQRALAEPGYLAFGEAGLQFTAADYASAVQERHQLNRVMSAFFETYDLLLTPTLPVTAYAADGPPPREIDGKPVTPAGSISFTFPFNITGHPAASVPTGRAPDGLPVGLQIIGPRYADGLVLQASAAYEAARPWAWPE